MNQRADTDTRFWWGLALVVALAFALRLLYLWQFAALPIFDFPVGDSAAHLRRAGEIARGQWLPARPFYYCSIFYPYFLAAVLGGLHGSLKSVALIQIAAGSACVGLLALTGRVLFGTAVGLVVGGLAALYGPSAFFEADVLGVVWGQLALAGTLLLVALWFRSARRPLLLGLAGACCGLAIVERPNLLLVAAAIALWLAFESRPAWARSVAAFVSGISVPLLVVLALNVAGTGQWVPLTTSGGINLSLAYHEGAAGTYDEPWEREAPEFSAQHVEPEEAMIAWAGRKLGRDVTPQEASRYWAGQALDYIRTHPRTALAVTFRKALLLVNAVEVPNHLDFAFIGRKAPALGWMFLTFAPILVLAGFGFAAGRSAGERVAVVLCAVVAVAAWASVVPFTVADRYRAPMLPGLFLLAGVGLVTLVKLVRDPGARRQPRVLAGLGLAVVLAAVSAIPLIRPLHGRDHWMFADAYERRGELPQAIANYELAVEAEPNDGELLNNLGNAYKRAGRRGPARAAFERAIAAEPRLAMPHKSLGTLLIGDGKLDSAYAALAEAQRLAPRDAEAAAMMGAIRAEQGNVASAESSFALARALAPGDPRLAALMAHYEQGGAVSPAKAPPPDSLARP